MSAVTENQSTGVTQIYSNIISAETTGETNCWQDRVAIIPLSFAEEKQNAKITECKNYWDRIMDSLERSKVKMQANSKQSTGHLNGGGKMFLSGIVMYYTKI